MPFRHHLGSSADLVTTYEETRAGFVALALERGRRAVPYVEEARSLKVLAARAMAPADLPAVEGIRPALLTAAGVSDKAAGHMQDSDKDEAIRGLIANFLEPAGSGFVEELVFRFLLTRGDTLGGSMRNVGGALAQRKLTRAVIAAVSVTSTRFRWLHVLNGSWIAGSRNDPDIELSAKALTWDKAGEHRTLRYNLAVPIVNKNIDVCLLRCGPDELPAAIRDPGRYLALGELKGGIDPAGADEHWKTARTALDRIRSAFAKHRLSPATFFVGAAVAAAMADEIWSQLDSGALSNAANLTGANQVASLCEWLCGL